MKPNKQLLQVLAPYGKWQHAKGLQIVDEIAAKEMKANFEKFFHAKFQSTSDTLTNIRNHAKLNKSDELKKSFLLKMELLCVQITTNNPTKKY